MSNYPAQIDTTLSLPTAIDGQTPVHGIIFNRLRDAVLAIEAELGTKPSSVYTNVKTRLETIESNLTSVAAINLSGDVIGPFSATEVVSLHGRPLSSAAPIFNQVLGWDGIAWSPMTGVYSSAVGGDLTGVMPNPLVTGLFGRPIANTAPNTLDTLTWNGSAWAPSPSFTAGNGLYTSGNTINVGANADQTIVVNADDIQVNPSFYSINPINGTLVQRDPNFGFINVNDASGSARYGAGILLTEASAFTLQQSQRTSDLSVHSMRIAPQAPYSLATGSNRLPGNLSIDIPAAAGGLASTVSGYVSFTFGGTEYVRIESTPTMPTAGILNFPGNGQILTSANLQVRSTVTTTVSSGDDLTLNSSTNVFVAAPVIDATGDIVSLTGNSKIIATAPDVVITCDDIALKTNQAIIGDSFNFSLSQTNQISDIDCNDITISSQAPYASSTGTNRLPGDIIFDIPAPAGALAAVDSGKIRMKFGGTEYIRFSAVPSGPVGYLTFPLEGTIEVGTNFTTQAYGSVLLSQFQQTSDADCNDFTILSQQPFTTATGTNRLPGDIILITPDAVGALATTDSGFIRFKSGVTDYMHFNYTPTDTRGLITFSNNGGIGAVNDLYVQGSTLGLASGGVLSVDSPNYQHTGAGNASWQNDNDQTFNCGGTFTINGLGGAINLISQGSGISLTDPAGGGITIDSNGGGGLNINCGSGTSMATPVIDFDPGADFALVVNSNPTSGGTGYAFTINAGAAVVGAGTGGNIILLPGQGASSHHGNIAMFGNPSSVAGTAGGSNVVWMTDRATAPGTNPSGGTIFYSESGTFKIRSVGNTVTLGNKPSVTGSKVSGAALISLLTVLATAGIITDNTTA